MNQSLLHLERKPFQLLELVQSLFFEAVVASYPEMIHVIVYAATEVAFDAKTFQQMTPSMTKKSQLVEEGDDDVADDDNLGF